MKKEASFRTLYKTDDLRQNWKNQLDNMANQIPNKICQYKSNEYEV
jgi:photosystem II stability/assembly factor-like uncharacterized protein